MRLVSLLKKLPRQISRGKSERPGFRDMICPMYSFCLLQIGKTT